MSRGGKIGVLVSILSLPILFVYLADIALPRCYFEEGCGEHEWMYVTGVAVIAVITAIVAGLAVCLVTNRSWN